ncbi:MAG: ribosome small subunit-dependent GTPase A [Clostridiales bacterium]|nr:ribosome small subunit-dependent GTPase A [Clostridiales bacterium]
MKLAAYGFTPDLLPPGTPGTPARVTAVHRERYELVCAAGFTHGRLKRSAYEAGQADTPTVGDYVIIDDNPLGDSMIPQTLPRKSFFSRRSAHAGRGGQAVAANFDHVFILQSLNRDLNLRRLERYLTLAWDSGGMPVVLLTKADLKTDIAAITRQVGAVATGAPVIAVSAVTGQGLEDLQAYLQPGRTIVLLGSTGVGKSTLVNTLSGQDVMAVREIREDDSRGRHTTTHRQLILLPGGAMLIDTPGMRQMGMWDVDGGLDESFADVTQYLGQCRFDDRSHASEPGCAILAAIADGALPPDRWESYQRLKDEARYADDRAAYLKEKSQWHKEIAKRTRQHEEDAKKHGGKW